MEDFWKSERFRTWWETYHWEALAKIDLTWPTKGGERQTLQDYWRDEESRLIEFGGRKWTSLHLPQMDLEGNRCPPEIFLAAKGEVFWQSILQKLNAMVLPTGDTPEEQDSDEKARWADLRGVMFPDWDNVWRGGKLFVDFTDAVFLERSDFSSTAFVRATFDNAVFSRVVWFWNASWSLHASFMSAWFYSYAWFPFVKFCSSAEFSHVRFANDTSFAGSDFAGWAAFEHVEFDGQAWFINTTFHRGSYFDSAVFKSHARFRTARSSGYAFQWDAVFRDVQFFGEADFAGREFLALADFTGAKFARVAQFHGAKLHPEIKFERESFDWRNAVKLAVDDYFKKEAEAIGEDEERLRETDEQSKQVRRERRQLRQRETLLKRQQRTWQSHAILKLARPHMKAVRAAADAELKRHELAFRTLRLAFAAYQNVEDEMMFYGLELDARRARSDVPAFESVIAWLYRVSSGYGQSLLLPVVWAAAIWAGAAGLLFAETRCMNQAPAAAEIGIIALRKFVPFLPTLQDQSASWIAAAGAPASLWPTLATMNVVLPVLAIGLVTVFLIALRRRFQIER